MSINFKVIALIGQEFEPARFGFPDLPKRETQALLIWLFHLAGGRLAYILQNEDMNVHYCMGWS